MSEILRLRSGETRLFARSAKAPFRSSGGAEALRTSNSLVSKAATKAIFRDETAAFIDRSSPTLSESTRSHRGIQDRTGRCNRIDTAWPVASGIREVISAMEVSTDLERIADQFVTTARTAKHMNARSTVR